MFRELVNEATLSFELHTVSPLCIKSGAANEMDPTLPDNQCIRTKMNGADTVFIPGSSVKGVIRSRVEKIFNLFDKQCCNIVDRNTSCNNKNLESKSAKEAYAIICPACKMFGCTNLGGRVSFKDAFPMGEVAIGTRDGVGIDRITGAAKNGAKYDFEVVEDATFKVDISLTNYELKHLKVLLYVLQDIKDGYVAFGGSTTRGNGKMEVQNVNINLRDYRKTKCEKIQGYKETDKGNPLKYESKGFYYKGNITGLEEALNILQPVEL